MKRKLCFLFFLVISLLLLSGCGSSSGDEELKLSTSDPVNDVDGVTMTIKEGTISSTGLTVIIENQTDKEITFGEDYWLEMKIDGEWYEAPPIIESYGFNDIGFGLGPLSKEESMIDWGWLYGGIKSGEYRIIKDIIHSREESGYEQWNLAAEFTIE